jgi:transposase
MDVVVARCAGLDVHKDTVVACVRLPGPDGGRVSETRTFGTVTVELLGLRDWLVAHGVTLVGMESTGVFWRPVFYVLEDAVECWLLNAQHMRNVPGRKPDVADAAGIAQLVEYGLAGPRSCRRRRSGSCGNSPATARPRSRNALGRRSGWTRPCRTLG